MDGVKEYDWASMMKTVNVVAAPPRSQTSGTKRAYSETVPSMPSVPSVPSGTVEVTMEEQPMKVSWIPESEPVTRENLLKYLEVTEDERRKIWSYDQRDPEWHIARYGRLTGSRAGSAAGHNKYVFASYLICIRLTFK